MIIPHPSITIVDVNAQSLIERTLPVASPLQIAELVSILALIF
jgi:hypothetical protein